MTRPIRLGQIPYLNCILFFHGLEGRSDVRLAPLVPSALSGAAMDGVVDAGPVPLVDTWEIDDAYASLGGLCISGIERARSVLFFSKRPFERLDGAEIGVTHESSTSVRLLDVLLTHVWRVRPARLTAIDRGRNDALLLIGDDALRDRHGAGDFPHVADLGEVWAKWTGLPFVFARWVARRDLPDAARDHLRALLEQSMTDGWKHLDRIAAMRAERLHMTIDEVHEYLQGFRFRETEAELAAMAKFRELDAGLARRERKSDGEERSPMSQDGPPAPVANGMKKS
jgi:chorismate dehydratase